MTDKKSKGGKGKAEFIRNKAIYLLHTTDKETFNFNVLGNLFNRNRKTIAEILTREVARYNVGVR